MSLSAMLCLGCIAALGKILPNLPQSAVEALKATLKFFENILCHILNFILGLAGKPPLPSLSGEPDQKVHQERNSTPPEPKKSRSYDDDNDVPIDIAPSGKEKTPKLWKHIFKRFFQ